MKKSFLLSLSVAAIVAFSMTPSAKAQTSTPYNGDLLIGFTAGSGNDLIYDLGVATNLTNGQTWNLSSLISGFTLSSVQWGVIGNTLNGLSLDNKIYTTTVSSSVTPGPVSKNLWNALKGQATAIYSPFPAAGAGQSLSIAASATSGNSWYEQTAGGATLTTQYRNAYENPNVTGLTSAALWSVDDGTGGGNGAAILLGSFSLAANGVVTFNTVSTAPPAPALSITRTNNTSTISFATANGATYSLLATNIAGLGTPKTNWLTVGSSITGNGGTTNFTDTTTDSNRVYSVTAH